MSQGILIHGYSNVNGIEYSAGVKGHNPPEVKVKAPGMRVIHWRMSKGIKC